MPEKKRRLAAIMFTDIVGYTALMGSDEESAFELLRRNRDIQKPLIEKYDGEWMKEMGDGILASFFSATDAVLCAAEIQQKTMQEGISLRIGIHEGEVVFNEGDVLGDGVNVASRLEELAEEGCTYISGAIYKEIKNKKGVKAKFIGEKSLKNVDDPVTIYQVDCEVPTEVDDQNISAKSGDKKIAGRHIQKLAFIILILGFVTIAALVLFKTIIPEKSNILEDKTIAVLPFKNLSTNLDEQYLADGMMDAILNHLQKIGELDVKSRTSVEQFRNPTLSLPEIAKRLNVNYIVEGSFQKVGNEANLVVQLLLADEDRHIWSEEYTRDWSDIFSVQREVAQAIASELKTVITAKEKINIELPPTTNLEAYDNGIRGISMIENYSNTLDDRYLERANKYFNRALQLDPNYYDALIGKSKIFNILNDYDSGIYYADLVTKMNPKDDRGYELLGKAYGNLGNARLSLENLTKAVQLNPENNQTFLSLSDTYCNLLNNYDSGIYFLSKALSFTYKVKPSLLTHLTRLLIQIGHFDKAVEILNKKIMEQNVCSDFINYHFYFSTQGRFQEGIEFMDSLCAMMSCEIICNRSLFLLNTYEGNIQMAEEYYIKCKDKGFMRGPQNYIIAMVYQKQGRMEEAEKILQIYLEEYKGRMEEGDMGANIHLARINCLLGNFEESLRILNRFQDKDRWNEYFNFIREDPFLEEIMDFPEFNDFVKYVDEKGEKIRIKVTSMIEEGVFEL